MMKYPLTPEQISVATAPAGQPLMVLAPPGTGNPCAFAKASKSSLEGSHQFESQDAGAECGEENQEVHGFRPMYHSLYLFREPQIFQAS
jgi:hypothetical protein